MAGNMQLNKHVLKPAVFDPALPVKRQVFFMR
jgi:hypothetical protein